MELKVSDIAAVTGGEIINECGDDIIVTEITTDSRKADKNTLFVPLIGEKVDGHQFVLSAGENGCRVSLTQNDEIVDNITLIKTENNEKALGDIAAFLLKKNNPFKIAVTGSVGKTTTRDMIFSVVSKWGKSLRTDGNFNNNIGLPLTVFRLTDEKCVVLEMGMDKRGEIDYLSSIVRPDIGVITNIGYSHIEKLGSRDNILAAKAEMINNISDGGFLILNGDDMYLRKLKGTTDKKLIYFGCDNKDCDVKFNIIDENDGVFEIDKSRFRSGLPGKHNIYNAVAAIIIGRYLNLPDDKIREGLEECKYTKLRLDFIDKDGFTVIEDCYNASPDSMKASLKVLAATDKKRKIAVLGSVNELGEYHDSLLYDVGKFVSELGIDMLITVGDEALPINKGAEECGFETCINLKNNDEAKKYIKENIRNGDIYLVKGSRGFKMEEICNYLLGREE